MQKIRKTSHARLLTSSAVGALLLSAGAAWAEAKPITIPAQSLSAALHEFGAQTGRPIMFSPAAAASKATDGVDGVTDQQLALAQLLQGTGLTYRKEGDAFVIVEGEGGSGPQSGSAAGDGAEGTVDTLVVTAQKREEDIQDVPIAISAFTQEDLTRSQVAGGPDLMTQVPNFTFTKTNFSSYSIQIRGIGTQAVSATVDPAVAVAFNNTPFVRNRFFEQEFYDLQRVEVLRGPQGTLYGRNATAGVVNIISAKPAFNFEAKASADVSNYNSTRIEGMVNVPLVDDLVALRVAAAWTKRDGYVTNQITGDQIDGRDLWSTRVSLRFAPNDRFDANLIWEHFEEDDDRLRSGKQTCKRDVVTEIFGIPIDYTGGSVTSLQGNFSQGCAPSSMYSPDSFQTPNGFTVQYYHPLWELQFPTVQGLDPYLSTVQSRDLRVIESTLTPTYRAETDVVELQMSLELGSNLTLASETGYSSDTLFSFQDLNRFNTAPGIFNQEFWDNLEAGQWSAWRPNLLTDGVFCDPQLGCANRLVAGDLSTAESTQFSEELRLSSDFEGPFNFSLGGNFLRYDTEDKYYVFVNTLSFLSAMSRSGHGQLPALSPWEPGVTDNIECLRNGVVPPDPSRFYEVDECVYIDPNPIGSLNDEGHNYFLSRNPFKLISYAIFGEAYYNIAENLKVTAGLRWTVDKKEAPRIYSWLLGSHSVGLPVVDVIEQEWREPTGRLTIDWKPDLSFTDETLLYASYAHGYKAGGANPPPPGTVMYAAGGNLDTSEALVSNSATHPRTFEPEFIDAFEVGSKNTFLDGRMTVNLAAFYYDYEGYQISQIVNRSAVNLNFDATVWGLEVEADWRPMENLRLGFKGGYQDTDVADGMEAVDLMDRTAGNPDWILLRPHPALTSNCIMPRNVIILNGVITVPGAIGSGFVGGCEQAYLVGNDPITGEPYDPDNPGGNVSGYDGFDPRTAPNNGEGFDKDLSGNELPNAPHYTATITADYTIPLPNDWLATLHTDLYYQSEAWTRIFNMEGYDKLKAYTNINVAAIFSNEDAGWQVMAYVKNVLDKDNITGAFLFSDDTLLTTNVFLNEPRLYGLRVTKNWSGGSWPFSRPGDPKARYPFTVELGGGVQRIDAPTAPFNPAFFGAFTEAVDPQAGYNEDLDWGDGRSIRLTYTPASGPFSVSLGARFGRTNGAAKGNVRDPHKTCLVAMTGCETTYPQFLKYPADYALNRYKTNEEYTLADFAVGRDFGLGAGMRSQVQLGLRYAQFQSDQRLHQLAIPDWVLPVEYSLFNPTQHHRYDTSLQSERDFEGVGPALSWEGSKTLFGGPETGEVDLEWAVTGGVLFGRQTTNVAGSYVADYYDMPYFPLLFKPKYDPTSTVAETISIHRSQSTQTPLLDLSLGLAYDVGRVKVGAGYRWERYFDVLDTGYDEREESDRTIDGPYFKFSVGFGGG